MTEQLAKFIKSLADVNYKDWMGKNADVTFVLSFKLKESDDTNEPDEYGLHVSIGTEFTKRVTITERQCIAILVRPELNPSRQLSYTSQSHLFARYMSILVDEHELESLKKQGDISFRLDATYPVVTIGFATKRGGNYTYSVSRSLDQFDK